MAEIKRNANKVRAKLKSIEQLIDDQENSNKGTSDNRIKKTQVKHTDGGLLCTIFPSESMGNKLQMNFPQSSSIHRSTFPKLNFT